MWLRVGPWLKESAPDELQEIMPPMEAEVRWDRARKSARAGTAARMAARVTPGCTRISPPPIGQNPVHVGEVEDEAALGDGAAGDAGARALDGDGHALGGAGLGERGEDLFLGAGEGDAVGAAGAPGFVAQVVGLDLLERFDHAGQYNLLRGEPHG
jgi:hypothetical protein